jgi:TolA-binding protein
MKKLVVVVLVLLVAIGALGYWRGWFSVTKQGKVDVQVDPAKFKKDKEAFGKEVREKAKTMKDKIASLWKKTERLTGDDKVQAKKELAGLEQQHERLQKQLQELESEDIGQDRFESTRKDLAKTIEEVQKKIDKLTEKLDKGKE